MKTHCEFLTTQPRGRCVPTSRPAVDWSRAGAARVDSLAHATGLHLTAGRGEPVRCDREGEQR
jgi:hypothetical protein